jgi:hypothetical protein
MANATRVTSLLLALLLSCGVVQAQHRWNAKEKHWYSDWLWWVGEAAIAAAFAADAHSTALVRYRCPGCRETNPVLGPHPGNRRLVMGSGIVLFGSATALHIASWKACPDPSREYKSWHVACDTLIPAIAASFVVPAAVHNYRIASRYRSATLSVVTPALSRAHSTSRPFINSWLPSRSQTPFSLPNRVSTCNRTLALCGFNQPKEDPRFVRLR